jgi:hypothetical protein
MFFMFISPLMSAIGQLKRYFHVVQHSRQTFALKVVLCDTAATVPAMAVLPVRRSKCPDAQATSNDHCNPGSPHRNFNASDMHRPLIQSPHGLKNGDHSEETT